VVLNNGTTHAVTDYWVADGYLEYVSPRRHTQSHSTRSSRPAKNRDPKCSPWPSVCPPLRARTLTRPQKKASRAKPHLQKSRPIIVFVPGRVARSCCPVAGGTILQAPFSIAVQFVLIGCNSYLQFQ
jgi:hypothetical protein